MKLIVGLGNPGKEYNLTRHNIGFQIIDEYISNEKWSKNKYAEYVILNINNEKVLFIKPTTYMNLSGKAVKYFLDFYKLEFKDILIIQDDLDLETGSFKLKINSSSGGHNGIQSIIDNLSTTSFLRLKVGIGKPQNGDTIDYVLNRINQTDLEKISKNFKIFNNLITDFINNKDINILMNKYNGIL